MIQHLPKKVLFHARAQARTTPANRMLALNYTREERHLTHTPPLDRTTPANRMPALNYTREERHLTHTPPLDRTTPANRMPALNYTRVLSVNRILTFPRKGYPEQRFQSY